MRSDEHGEPADGKLLLECYRELEARRHTSSSAWRRPRQTFPPLGARFVVSFPDGLEAHGVFADIVALRPGRPSAPLVYLGVLPAPLEPLPAIGPAVPGQLGPPILVSRLAFTAGTFEVVAGSIGPAVSSQRVHHRVDPETGRIHDRSGWPIDASEQAPGSVEVFPLPLVEPYLSRAIWKVLAARRRGAPQPVFGS
jgi:hypothetical protein